MVKKYRKKPVIIEAIQWTGKNLIDIYTFLSNKTREKIIEEINHDFQDIGAWDNHVTITVQDGLYIPTIEGDLKSEIGDFIIKDPNEGFYPCNSDFFIKTYEEVTE